MEASDDLIGNKISKKIPKNLQQSNLETATNEIEIPK